MQRSTISKYSVTNHKIVLNDSYLAPPQINLRSYDVAVR